MDIRFLHTKTCHIYHKAFDELEEALKETGEEVKFEVVLITTQEQAEKYKFSGSPAIQINREDIDPQAKNLKKYNILSCRPYFWGGASYDYLPKEMTIEALRGKSI